MHDLSALSGLRVLVADDDLLISMDIEQMLQEVGCIVIGPVSTVVSALGHVLHGGIDCAVLDFNLHGVSILPVAEELSRRMVPFVLVTGYARQDTEPPLLRDARRIVKPFQHERLVAALEASLKA